MEKAEDKKMIAEMKSFLADKAKASRAADDAKAEEQLPFESIDSYSSDPVGFGEMSLRMLSKVEFVFDLAAKENRFSSKYLKRCTQLEKGIKYLGSLCVTKYALQTQGQTFPQLGQLSTEKLYCMTSHHFRKLDQAVSEYMFEHRDVPDKLFDMEMRYFNLLERLRSTEVKIKKFHNSYIFGETNDAPIIHGFAFSEKSRTRSIHQQHDEAPAFRHAPAFSAYGGKLSGISGQGSDNEEGRMKNEDGVRSRQGSDSEANCGKSLNEEEKKLSGVSAQESEVTVAPSEDAEKQEVTNGTGAADSELSRRGLSQDVTEKDETAEYQKSETKNQREQLSKAGSHGKVEEEFHNNEEIRMKKEEKKSDAELPPCLEIMKRVMERSRESDDNSLTFTIKEMEFLAADPLFARLDPRLAADLRKILEAGPPG